jgi:hypothetical protein
MEIGNFCVVKLALSFLPPIFWRQVATIAPLRQTICHFSVGAIHTTLTSRRMQIRSESNANLQEHVIRDLNLISRWVKSHLFKGCKFLYKGERELEPNGKIHTFFENNCFPTLEGIKIIQEAGDDPPFTTIELYKERIWALATKERIVSNGLALRRSGVYTVMQNRFLGKLYYP